MEQKKEKLEKINSKKNKLQKNKVNSKSDVLFRPVKTDIQSRLDEVGSAQKSFTALRKSLVDDKEDTVNIKIIGKLFKFKTLDLINMSSAELTKKYNVDHWLDKWIFDKFQKFNTDISAFGRFLFQNLTWMVLLEILMFSLFFKLFYIRSKRKYIEHFIFLLNSHSWIFIIGILAIITPIMNEWLWMIFSLLIVVYLFQSMRVVYQQSFFITIVKFLFLSLIALFVLLVSFFLVILASSILF